MVNCIGVRTDGYVNKHIFIIHCILVFTTDTLHGFDIFIIKLYMGLSHDWIPNQAK